jgi:hypothetical protein
MPEATLRCPACRAAQEWSDTCRRCKADLRLLREAAEACERSRRLAVHALAANQPGVALRHARQIYQLRPEPEVARLRAVCALLAGQWDEARTLAREAV